MRDASVVGRYNPIYYGLVGVPLVLDPSWGGILAARLISAAIVSFMLTWALFAAVRWSGSRAMVAGIFVAMTPTVFELAGAVNPNALEIAAGVALFAGLIPLVDPDRTPTKGMIALVGVAAVELALLRALGPFWVIVAALVMFMPFARSRVTELWRMTMVRWWSASIAVAGLAGAVWTLAFKTLGVAAIPQPPTRTVNIVKNAVFLGHGGWDGLLQESVAALGWREFALPGFVLACWYAAAGLLILGALFFGARVDRWRIVAILAVGFGIATLATIHTAQQYGYGWQGRYILPLTVGAPIYAAWALGRRNVLDARQSRQLVRGIALLVLPVGFFALWWSRTRWEIGFSAPKTLELNPFVALGWEPRIGPVLPIVFAIIGFAVLGWFAFRVTRAGRPVVDDDGDPADMVMSGSALA